MRLLPDTHCWIWWSAEPERLGPRTHQLLSDPRHSAYFSVASAWEIAIKQGTGRLKLEMGAEEFIRSSLAHTSAEVLPIELRHSLVAGALPEIHRDPFDRMLIAQAQCEDLTIITADKEMARYSVLAHDATA